MPDHCATRSALWRGLASLLLISLIALSWTGLLDQQAQAGTSATLKRALATYAVARGLNAVISVAQGTEIAIQPVGVGLTITAGEILDPLNDLVERFSWLVLVACGSLGTQLLMTELLANPWVSGVMTLALVTYLITLWWPRTFAGRANVMRVCTLLVFARFLFATVTLLSGWVDQALLAERQAEAESQIALTQQNIEGLQSQPDFETDAEADASMLERFSDFIDEQRHAMNINTELQALSTRVEEAIEDLVRLMVLFLVQTIIVPVAGLALAYAGCKWFWRVGAKPTT